MSDSLIVTRTDADATTQLRDTTAEPDFLGAGDVLIDVEYSSLNYKDAMALAGDKGVMRVSPLIPGIDAVGTVRESSSPEFTEGQTVLVNGAGLGEFRHGGYTPRLRVDAASTIALPDGIDAWHAAAIGTAGFTAALCVDALERHRATWADLGEGIAAPEGPILVTGATGGVGSVAIMLLAALGYEVTAATGRAAEHSDYLRGLGASDIIDRAELTDNPRPLTKGRFAGAVDTLGSHGLAGALAATRWGGVVTACGLAQGPDLPASVLPFILRAVRLVGINSVDAPKPLREHAWALLAQHLDLEKLAGLTQEIVLADAPAAGAELLAGRGHGRTVVRVA
ncbi:MDR family oxidoreductase [Corynebacterium uberis]|uniref:MDR family oxidoreductase n=1 Tax=Corynebacterium TaxID=1716 RepID=UPI001D0A03A0|nr:MULTISPECIES: MDR family oxidoreductase [Corynebacterium]MCZ9309889.1 oxidoreductase [Corynebacterium sp. c6VSa_13]UDL73187.1 oxidoreductase [Corynebacterium uberis]UDL75936.1 oxidoreductase [Corynebacterium uberis]UDL78148.1 oxidoreductase [Corynebacterium uberis]UDL80431.1 oxidoreductase [Corynebacterium uberis]